ncbi:unnamed protein product [Rotaria magnacalcarata]|uniref:Uncharacterized protein n=1 Tax=Rotaria magnacalcarata TaxID=392030 RepID=A0A815ABZ9_9BILA|nr:unnamed protein product [Rotaria magnacalcarata]CAF3836960.1 unnamed protein product [Rotaria magnacalcarata]
MVSTYVDITSSRYPIELWNVNDALLKNLPRTNNHVEGYNGRLGSLFPVRPHLFRFIECLRDDPCRENRRDFGDFEKNRRKVPINHI